EEPGRERQQREQERRGVVHAREELLGDDGDQRPVEVEVVPLEYRAQRRREDDAPVCGVDAFLFCHESPFLWRLRYLKLAKIAAFPRARRCTRPASRISTQPA